MLNPLRSKVFAVDAELFTWEVISNFEQEYAEADLLKKLQEECPNLAKAISSGKVVKFWKMISFNGAEGRRNRYLVAVHSGDLSHFRLRYDRVLPRQIALYGHCDALMRNTDGMENFRYAAMACGVLYILVFMEGRLCHWSEEVGYGSLSEDENKGNAEERLERFDEFLKRDELFSRTENFVKIFDDKVYNDAFAASGKDDFASASRDPFWEKLDLDDYGKIKPRRKIRWTVEITAFTLILVFCINFIQNKVPAGENMLLLAAPALDLPDMDSTVPDSAERQEETAPMGEVAERAPSAGCVLPSLKVQGLVAGKIAKIILPDQSGGWMRIGDTLEGFRVENVGRDRIQFSCGGKSYDVLSGR